MYSARRVSSARIEVVRDEVAGLEQEVDIRWRSAMERSMGRLWKDEGCVLAGQRGVRTSIERLTLGAVQFSLGNTAPPLSSRAALMASLSRVRRYTGASDSSSESSSSMCSVMLALGVPLEGPAEGSASCGMKMESASSHYCSVSARQTAYPGDTPREKMSFRQSSPGR